MVLDSAPADAEIQGDICTGVASKDQIHDLALSRSEARDVVGCNLTPSDQLADQLILFLTKQRAFHALMFCELGFVACGRAGLRPFKDRVRRRDRGVHEMFNTHVVGLRCAVRIRCLDTHDGLCHRPRCLPPAGVHGSYSVATISTIELSSIAPNVENKM